MNIKFLGKIIFCALVTISFSYAYGRPTKKSRTKTQIDYTVRIDSIEQLRERYSDMLAYAPDRAAGTLGQIKHKFNLLPEFLRDTLLASHYKTIVHLYEEERLDRASAFANCYYALAKSEDPNLGPLYLNDIVLSLENDKPERARQFIDDLRRYAELNNLDYDQDLREAEENYYRINQNCKFKRIPLHKFVESGLWSLDYEKMRSYVCNEDGEVNETALMQYLSYVPTLIELEGTRVKRYSLKVKKNKNGDMMLKSLSSEDYGFNYDNDSKTMYSIWGHEQTKSANPILLGGGRQTIQNSHALVSGELAKKKYSYGQRLTGNVVSTLIDAGLNALFDWLSVTTEHYYRCELSLTMTNPNTLEGILAVASTTVKSNNLSNPDTKSFIFPIKYYRTKPEYGYCPMDKKKPLYSGLMKAISYQPLADEFSRNIKILEPKFKESIKEFKKQHKGEKPAFENFESQYNYEINENLRKLAEESLYNHPLLK